MANATAFLHIFFIIMVPPRCGDIVARRLQDFLPILDILTGKFVRLPETLNGFRLRPLCIRIVVTRFGSDDPLSNGLTGMPLLDLSQDRFA